METNIDDGVRASAWRRLDRDGTDFARIEPRGDGWNLVGAAVFAEGGQPCSVRYSIACDASWTTQHARIEASIGRERVTREIVRQSDGRWRVDGVLAPALDGCEDLDLEFSPSTNLLPIRRNALQQGEDVAVHSAWLRFPSLTLERLEQTYRREAPDRVAYRTKDGAYSAQLVVDEAGFVRVYPNAWTVIASA